LEPSTASLNDEDFKEIENELIANRASALQIEDGEDKACSQAGGLNESEIPTICNIFI
jgi:hypothetical protein